MSAFTLGIMTRHVERDNTLLVLAPQLCRVSVSIHFLQGSRELSG